jgi:hypothetical protein
MACSGCGASSCRGCKDITIELPEGRGIDGNITDNGDGTWTITYTDGTTQIINTPGTVPNDSWVELDETDMLVINYTGTATYDLPTHGTFEIDLRYKILNEDTVVIHGRTKRIVDITGLTNTVGCNFRFAPFGSSNWFAGTKVFKTTVLDFRFPATVFSISGSTLLNNVECAIPSVVSGNNMISINDSVLNLPNGRYTFYTHFEFTFEIE